MTEKYVLPPEVQALLDDMEQKRDLKIARVVAMSDEERAPIVERAVILRYGPTGYNGDEALIAAIDEMVEISDEELAASKN